MVYLIAAGFVFGVITFRALRKAPPMPLEMEEAEEGSLVLVIRQRSLSDRLKARVEGEDPYLLAARSEIEQMIRGQV